MFVSAVLGGPEPEYTSFPQCGGGQSYTSSGELINYPIPPLSQARKNPNNLLYYAAGKFLDLVDPCQMTDLEHLALFISAKNLDIFVRDGWLKSRSAMAAQYAQNPQGPSSQGS
jgi:hypothetical protein